MRRTFAFLLICVLCTYLISMPIVAFSEGADGLVLSATVQAKREIALKAPASGELAPYTLRAGDTVAAGETLFTVEPKCVYADIDGTVADVYANAGDIADAAVSRYGAVLKLNYTDRYELVLNMRTGYNNVENRDISIGMPVYLRSASETYRYADGVITGLDGSSFTVQVIGGDLRYNQDVKVYREPDYANNTLMGRGKQSIIAPYDVTASGTIVEMAVKKGDTVKAGDLLFSYVPDALEPETRGKADATAVKADDALIVNAISVTQGASVQKGQALATAYYVGDYELLAQVEEGETARLHVGDVMSVRFEELDIKAVEGTVTAIGMLGSEGDVSKYVVQLDFEAPEGVWLGMHATVEK